jgi:hypothetical protein
MQKILLAVFISIFTTAANAETLKLPQGKGKVPHFTFEGEKGWVLKADRPQGDRWVVYDQNAKANIGKIEYKLSSTDQKQLPEVETKDLQLGSFKVEKFTVTTSFPNPGEKATEGLITSYNYTDGILKGLVLMTKEYDAKSELDKKFEKALSTIKLSK